MDSKYALKIAVEAGELMLRNGGETNRVEDTIKRILETHPCRQANAFVTPTGIFTSMEDDQNNIISMIRRVHHRNINLEKVALINGLSRDIVNGHIDFYEAEKKLEAIKNKKTYPPLYKMIASAITCGSFSFMLGGAWPDCINAFITGFILYGVITLCNQHNVTSFLTNILGGCTIALCVLSLMQAGVGLQMDKCIIGAIMPMVPGVGLTNAIRDILEGDYLSGTTRIMDAVLVAVSVATGVGMILQIWTYCIGDVLL